MSQVSEAAASDRAPHSNNRAQSNSTAGAHPLALAELGARSESEGAQAHGVQPIVSSVNPLHQVKATLHVCVGSAVITVGELLAAKEHQVLVLDRSVSQPVDLVLEGHIVARGQLVAVGSQFAVRLTELPIPLNTGFAEKP